MTDSVRLQRHAAVAANPPGDGKPVRLLGWISAVGVGGAILLMVGASFVRQDWMVPELQVPAVGPPFELHQHISGRLVATGLWIAVVLAVVGLVAGLVAARRGARGPIRLILIGGALAVLALMLAPPVGSTDSLDYASYGRLALLGHNPYVASPMYLRITDPIFGRSVPIRWEHQVSLYGPAATLEQYVAAKLGGESIARVVFWLKMWNALAFGAVAFVLDRVLRRNPAARLRGHLLWTVNPLLLWGLMAAGHIDVVAAAAGVLGLLAVGRQPAGVQPKIWRAVAAGALVGLAVAFKIDFAVFALGLAWALRRSVPALLAAVAGGLAVLGPTYAALGTPAFRALSSARGLTSQDSFWRAAHLTNSKYLAYLALLAFIGMAVLLLWRMPPGDRLRPAIRPALAISVAFVFMWPYQLPWYDTMIICVLVLFPASRLDWVVVGRLGVATLANMPGNPDGVSATALYRLDVVLVHKITPALLLTAAGLLVLLAVSGRWGVVQEDARTSSVPSSGKTPQIGGLSYLLRSGQRRRAGCPMALEIKRLTLAHLRGVDGLTWPVHGFVVRFPGGAALVDTGAGGPQRWLDDWRVVNRSVADALDELDMTPGDIGLVINTHLHFDHCGQNAVFKHAAFYVQRAELERARVESPKLTDWFDFMNARFELLDGDAEVLPGLRLVATPGHTVGHQSVLVDSADGQSDVLVGDAAYTPRQYLDPASDDLPDGQASDVDAWRASVARIRSAAPDRVHFCHDTEIIHS